MNDAEQLRTKKMSKAVNAAHSLVESCSSAGLYKRSQGRITRQVTFAALALAVASSALGGCDDLQLATGTAVRRWLCPVCGALAVVGLGWRIALVNLPSFADFLIAVEAEMNKVSWPTRSELFRASLVVLIMIFVAGGRPVRLSTCFGVLLFSRLGVL